MNQTIDNFRIKLKKKKYINCTYQKPKIKLSWWKIFDVIFLMFSLAQN